MKQFKLRFNTECKDGILYWRALIDDVEHLASDIQINVPVKTTSHILESGQKKWSISCESNNYHFDDNKKLFINPDYRACVVWLTGLSSAGKTTIANSLAKKLDALGNKTIILDGDEVRGAFQIGFDKESRIQHNINMGKMASVFEKQGLVVIVSLISPFREARDMCRTLASRFIEVYISTPLEICERRDVKGLYAKARRKEITDFTGIDSPYEPPINPEVQVDAGAISLRDCVNKIFYSIKE